MYTPLHGFLGRCSRVAEVKPIIFTHYFDIFQGSDLFCHFFAQADTCFGHRACKVTQVLLLGFDKSVDAVECQTPVVTDDTSAGIVVGKSGQESQ